MFNNFRRGEIQLKKNSELLYLLKKEHRFKCNCFGYIKKTNKKKDTQKKEINNLT